MPKKRSNSHASDHGPNKHRRVEEFELKNRRGISEPAFAWDLKDNVLALRTPRRENPEVPKCTFLANRAILCRESLVFSDILLLPPSANPKSEELCNGHPLTTVQDHPQDMRDFLQATHDWRRYVFSLQMGFSNFNTFGVGSRCL